MIETLPLFRPLRDVRFAAVIDAERAGQQEREREREQAARDREQAAYERGRAEAEAAGRAQLASQGTEFEKLQEGVLRSLEQAVPQMLQDCEHSLVALALEVAQKLVAGVPVSAEMVEAAVRDALTQAGQGAEVSVRLHPEDLALLQQQNSPLLHAVNAGRQLQFHASPDVTRGGCLIQTRFGTIDARRETKLELLKKTLLP